jgi:hypothetical protein
MKRIRVFRVVGLLALVLGLAVPVATSVAGPLTQGDFLVSDEVFSGNGNGRIREFTSSGQLVQTFTFPLAPGDGQPRSITVDSNGNIQIYNGTFTPYLTTVNPLTGAVVSNVTFPGWSTVNNITYGGLGAFGNFVFATDMATAGAGAPNGLIRFNINDGTALRFASGTDYIQLAVGKNGPLYAQYPGGSPGGNNLDVFDPTTLALQKRINLGMDLRSIAVDKAGHIFAVTINDSHIYEFDPNGVLLRSVDTGIRGYTDLTMDDSGRLLATSGGVLVLTDVSLSSFTELDVGTISQVGTFAAFVEPPLGAVVPEPSSLVLFSAGVAGLAGYAWRRRKRTAARSPTRPIDGLSAGQ